MRMNDQELLLTDEFVDFSRTISAIHDEKKALEEDFKKHFDEYKASKKSFETRVSEASAKWVFLRRRPRQGSSMARHAGRG